MIIKKEINRQLHFIQASHKMGSKFSSTSSNTPYQKMSELSLKTPSKRSDCKSSLKTSTFYVRLDDNGEPKNNDNMKTDIG